MDTVREPLKVTEDVQFRGIATEGGTVCSGSLLDLWGTIQGDLDVEKNGRVIVRGAVSGTIRNHGGFVRVMGAVGAWSDLSADAHTIFG